MVEALVDAVGDRTVGEERCLAALDGVDQHLLAANIQVSVMLAGEAGAGQIFGGGRTAHGHAQARADLGQQVAPALADAGFHRCRHRCGIDDLARLQAGMGE